MLTGLRYPGPPPPGVTLPMDGGRLVCELGDWAWAWEPGPPDLPIDSFESVAVGTSSETWAIDHVVVGTPDLDGTVAALVAAGADDRRRGSTVRGLRAAFLLAGTLVEVIEVGSTPRLVGVAFETDIDLREVAAAWRREGFEVTDPHPAVQPGRSILSLRDAPVAVMTRRAGGSTQ